MLKKINYTIESKRIHDHPLWNILVWNKDLVYIPAYHLCRLKPFRTFFFRILGTTGAYEPKNSAIISQKYHFLYFYIPKVASTSIKKSLAHTLYGRDIENRVHSYCFDEVIDITGEEYGSYFKFSFVRNPWDRVVSCYCDKILHKDFTNYKYKNGVYRKFIHRYGTRFRMGMSFERFIEIICNLQDTESDRHFRSQHTYIIDSEENCLVNFIGKFENIHADLAYIRRQTGLPNTELSVANQSRRAWGYKNFYTEKTKKMVTKRYAKDIDLFHYKF